MGDHTRAVIGDQTRTVTITAEVHFGSLFGATAVLVDDATARSAFAADGMVPSLSVTAAEGVSQSTLRSAVAEVLPSNVEAVTGAKVQDETNSSVQQALGFFTTFLLVFTGIALFVGSFIIANTFSMLVGQRSRELALLRAIGATSAQVMRVVLGEAVVIGLVGSALGIGLGLLIAAGERAALSGLLGAGTQANLPLHATTIALSILVGVLVTVMSAVLPARRAARVAPVAAMRGNAETVSGGLRRRGLVGAFLMGTGAITLGVAVSRSQVPWTLAALGALAAVIGMLVAAPTVARPVVRVITWPFVAVRGVVGRLARENTLRVPRRTATTASALMIGLALIAGLSVLASSVKASVTEGVGDELTSDYVLNSGTSASVPTSVAVAARTLPQVRSVATVSMLDVRIGTFRSMASATTAADVADNFVVEMAQGRLAVLMGHTVLVDVSTATARGWHVGDALTGSAGTLTGEHLIVGYLSGQPGFRVSERVGKEIMWRWAAMVVGLVRGRDGGPSVRSLPT